MSIAQNNKHLAWHIFPKWTSLVTDLEINNVWNAYISVVTESSEQQNTAHKHT